MQPLRLGYDDLESVGFDVGGVEMFDYQGQPFTGILEIWQDGVLCCEAEYQNSYLEGLQRDYFYPSGKIKMEYPLKNNNFDGVVKTWDEDGNVIRQSYWKNGEKLS